MQCLSDLDLPVNISKCNFLRVETRCKLPCALRQISEKMVEIHSELAEISAILECGDECVEI